MKRISHFTKFFNCVKFHLLLRDEHQLKTMNEWVEVRIPPPQRTHRAVTQAALHLKN